MQTKIETLFIDIKFYFNVKGRHDVTSVESSDEEIQVLFLLIIFCFRNHGASFIIVIKG